MRFPRPTLVSLLGVSSVLFPLAACSSSSGALVDGGVYDSFVADTGHDAKHDAAKEASPDSAAKDATAKDAAKDVDHADASDAAPTEAGDHDATVDAGVDAGKDAAKDAEEDAEKDAEADVHDAGPTLESYYFEGRWDTTSLAAYATQPVAEWAGSAVHATFTGTTIAYDLVETASATSASLGGGGFDSISVVIDNGAPVTIALNAGFPGTACMLPPPQACVAGENAANAATGLAAGKHTIAIYKTTDPYYGGKIQFKQLIPGGSGAAIVKAAYTFPHHIEWVGDDINAGRGDIIANAPMSCTNANAQIAAINSASNESLSYAGLVSTFFKAERHNISLGSSGVAQSLGGNAPLLPSVYSFVLPDEPMNPWSFASWSPGVAAPELVVVNLGSYGDFTNCFNTTDCPDVGGTGTVAPAAASIEAQIATAYESFLATLRAKYSTAFILVVSGNGYGGNIDAVAASDSVNYVVTQRAASGEKLTAPNQTMGFYSDAAAVDLGEFQYTCGYYPTSASQATLAGAVEGVIHAALGW